jgi:hypothetical protein
MTVETWVFDSSNLASADYDPDTGQATILFRRGGVYSGHLTPELWDKFKDAPSAGRFYHAHLKDLFA